MLQSFAEAMFVSDDAKRKQQAYRFVQGCETLDRVDYRLEMLDQEQLGEEALLHQFDLYQNVEQFTEEYAFQDKEMRSPLMNFLSLVN